MVAAPPMEAPPKKRNAIIFRRTENIEEGVKKMIVTNTETVAGSEIAEILGVVRGNTVRAKHVGKDILAGLKSVIGGEIRQYTELLTDGRGLYVRYEILRFRRCCCCVCCARCYDGRPLEDKETDGR